MRICPMTGHVCHSSGCSNQTQCPLDVKPQPVNIGWQCPKCGRGNAPYVATCPCGPAFKITNGGQTTPNMPHAAHGSLK